MEKKRECHALFSRLSLRFPVGLAGRAVCSQSVCSRTDRLNHGVARAGRGDSRSPPVTWRGEVSLEAARHRLAAVCVRSASLRDDCPEAGSGRGGGALSPAVGSSDGVHKACELGERKGVFNPVVLAGQC